MEGSSRPPGASLWQQAVSRLQRVAPTLYAVHACRGIARFLGSVVCCDCENSSIAGFGIHHLWVINDPFLKHCTCGGLPV
jgi:hypothetical protein